ncbi:MAG: YqaE/Pmp3 family membrane protein [Phycisphaerae bacterium]
MLYLLAVLLPPVAVLLCRRPLTALLNFVLTLLLWVPGMIHALFIVADYKANQRTDRVVEAMQRQGQQ